MAHTLSEHGFRKKAVGLSAIFLLLLLSLPKQANAQFTCGPTPDCSEPWMGPVGVTVMVPNGCSPVGYCPVYVTYCWRIACGGMFYDYKIVAMSYYNVPPCFCTTDSYVIWQQAVKQFIKDNPQHFGCPECGQGAASHWRFWMDVCSRTTTNPDTHETQWVSCNTNAWCFDTWDQCCIDGIPQPPTNFKSGVFGNIDCQSPCTPACFPPFGS